MKTRRLTMAQALLGFLKNQYGERDGKEALLCGRSGNFRSRQRSGCYAGWRGCRYQGYVLVEQDVLPGMGAPRESARRNREYLCSIESNFA